MWMFSEIKLFLGVEECRRQGYNKMISLKGSQCYQSPTASHSGKQYGNVMFYCVCTNKNKNWNCWLHVCC